MRLIVITLSSVAAIALLLLLWPIMTPFLIAMILAYLGDPLVDRLETYRMNRTSAVCVVFATLTLFTTLALLLIVPALIHQLVALVHGIPASAVWLQSQLHVLLQSAGIPVWEAVSAAEIQALVQQNWMQAGKYLSVFLNKLTSSSVSLVAWVGNLVLIPVVSFYLLRDFDDIVARVRKLLPRAIEPDVSLIAKRCDEVLSAFLRGQLIVMLALGLIYTVGLGLVGLELALLIGFCAGLASIVPYLGVIIGLLSASFAAYFQFNDLMAVLPVLVVFGIGQLLEGFVLTPLLVGDKIGLHPVAVIFAIMAGGQLAGFAGVLIALPVAAMLLVVAKYFSEKYMRSDFYQNKA